MSPVYEPTIQELNFRNWDVLSEETAQTGWYALQLLKVCRYKGQKLESNMLLSLPSERQQHRAGVISYNKNIKKKKRLKP